MKPVKQCSNCDHWCGRDTVTTGRVDLCKWSHCRAVGEITYRDDCCEKYHGRLTEAKK